MPPGTANHNRNRRKSTELSQSISPWDWGLHVGFPSTPPPAPSFSREHDPESRTTQQPKRCKPPFGRAQEEGGWARLRAGERKNLSAQEGGFPVLPAIVSAPAAEAGQGDEKGGLVNTYDHPPTQPPIALLPIPPTPRCFFACLECPLSVRISNVAVARECLC
ncbi:hypothetical protein ZHAS_00007525 [Anopheles sinensis]|uniref:Uncharacterized protein n=1 Tax=Anopheles sinensis TaxID=74873 RepID=A0A084VQ20_ANOSI|nr:hypothetical protein ZHAS_00007525 [Anopheles sinensis]